jgi:HK97 family phage prohead protease
MGTAATTSRRISADCLRSVEFRAVDTPSGDGRTFEGYGAVFNTPALISSWDGDFYEQIARGAFTGTLAKTTPVFQFDHGHDARTGSVPIGAIQQIKEDKQGLYVQARMFDNPVVEPIRQAIEAQAISGMSIRFQVADDEWRDVKGVKLKAGELDELLWNPGERGPLTRTIRQIDPLMELGPVVFPAYDTTTAGVRSLLAQLGPDERKQLAREVTARQAIAIPGLDPDEDPAALAAALDAVLDAACSYADPSNPDSVAQCFALLTAAEEVCDALLEALGVADPDDADTGRAVALINTVTRKDFTVGHLARGARVAVKPDAKPKPGEASPGIKAAQARDRLLRLKGIVR